MCDQEVESCGCVDEECTGARVQEGGADIHCVSKKACDAIYLSII